MKFTKRLGARLAIILASVTILTAAFAAPAFANPPHQVFDTYPKSLNNWFAAGTYVNVYNMNVDNDYFVVNYSDHCWRDDIQAWVDQVQGGENNTWCPFANHGLDTAYDGYDMVTIQDGHSGLCVGTDPAGTGYAYELSCGDVNNNGGGDGIIWIRSHDGCGSGYDLYVNRYWSDADSRAAGMYLDDRNGDHVSVANPGNGSCMRAA